MAWKYIFAMTLLGILFHITSGCPTQLCTCNVDNEIVCSSRKLDRVPHFTSRTSDKVYDVLDLSNNEIESVPSFAFQNIQVKSILLSRNRLIGISPRALTGQEDILQKLDLYDTQLFVIHWGVLHNLNALRELNLGRNGMFTLPVGLFDGLIHLEVLELAWNKIATIKVGFFRNLATLRSLNLLGNQITEIELGAFGHLRQLTTLNLNSNQLRNMNPFSLQGLHTSLQNLYLDGNLLMEIPTHIFIMLPYMKIIDISNNKISVVHPRAFNGASRVEEISLHNNGIYNISSNAFSGLRQLKKINLDNNNLQTFGDDCILRDIGAIQQFSVQNNPVDCTCRIAWIHRLNIHGTRVDGKCVSPEAFADIELSSLNFTLCDTFICNMPEEN